MVMSIANAMHLKHSGNLVDIKVTIRIIRGAVTVCMRDLEFRDFDKALKFLQMAGDELVREVAKDGSDLKN